MDHTGPPTSVALSAKSFTVDKVELPLPLTETTIVTIGDDQSLEQPTQISMPRTLRNDGWDNCTAAIPIDAPPGPERSDAVPLPPTQKQQRYSKLMDSMHTMNLQKRLIELATPAVLCDLVEALTAFDPDSRLLSHEVRVALLPMAEGTNQVSLPRLFLSHSKNDKSRFVHRFVAALKRKGFPVWLDEDSLRTGEPFWDSIARAIEVCDFVIVVLSENSVTSAGVAEELRAAQLQNLATTKVLPIRIDPIEFESIPKALLSRHVLDFVGWEVGDVFKQRCDKLAADIMALRADRMKQDEQPAADSSEPSTRLPEE
ncbi:MAG: toll/interleukin-1 receptor domain-containing protein [Nitrospirales bacterium]|nr:toll/interleukin-1 receptor domain-containing protein [Nitrospirales bacterium]